MVMPVEGSDYLYAYGRDITEQKKAELGLQKLSTAIEQSTSLIFITDLKGNIEYVNPMFEKVTKYSKEEAMGKPPRIIAFGETSKEHYEQLWRTITAGNTWRYVFKNKNKD